MIGEIKVKQTQMLCGIDSKADLRSNDSLAASAKLHNCLGYVLDSKNRK